MQGVTIFGRQTIYTILRQMPYSYDNKGVYYFCRDECGEYVLIYVCIADGEPKNLGKYLFLLRNYCLCNPILCGHIGHESWVPIVKEVITIPMGFSERRGLVLKLDVKNIDKLIPLKTILDSDKLVSIPMEFWLMREITLFLKVAKVFRIYASLYSGGILINPEERRLVFYDFDWFHQSIENDYDIKREQWKSLTEVCWKLLGFDGNTNLYKGYEFIGEYDNDLLDRLGLILSDESDKLDKLSDFVCEVADRLSVDEQPFVLQDEPRMREK